MDGERPEPPDPRIAADIPEFVDRLAALWEWAGSPGYRKKFQEMANRRLGAGHLSGTTVWRVLTSRQDLTRVQDPHRFVHDLVTVLGADPAPWLSVLDELLRPAEIRTEETPERPRRWPVRRIAVIAGVCLLVAGGVTAWSLTGGDDPPVAEPLDYSRPARISSADAGLRLAIDRDAAEPGAVAVLTGTGATEWELVAPHRDNPGARQIRPVGKLLMCLEVVSGEVEDRARVQQWGCNGEPHQYWRVARDGHGTVRLININSGQCLAGAGARLEAGMRVVQRICDEQQTTQRWRLDATDVSVSTSTAPLPGAAEYPGSGEDLDCAGIGPPLDPGTQPWVDEPWLVHNEDSARTRGRVTLGPGAFGAVELLRADRVAAGVRETFYWAEGWVTFTPRRFSMALQWTRVRGDGDWHTCAVPFTAEHRRAATVALPRDADGDGVRDVAFRICVTYTPELGPSTPVVNCAGRY